MEKEVHIKYELDPTSQMEKDEERMLKREVEGSGKMKTERKRDRQD